MSEWPEYLAGGGAAVTAILATFPINKAMFRQQVYSIPMLDAASQLRKEGVLRLYRGVLSPLLMKFISQSIMFGSYTQYSRMIHEKSGLELSQCKTLAALLAGASEALFMPLERAQVLMQDRRYHDRYKNTLHALFALRVYGVREYYRGLMAILLRNCPGTVIFFKGRESVQQRMQTFVNDSKSAKLVSDFVSGAVLGTMISTAFYPLHVTKTHLQLRVGGPHPSVVSMLTDLIEERGMRGMFRGVHANYTRSFLAWGIINVVYEHLVHVLRKCAL